MAVYGSQLVRRTTNTPRTTLSFITADDDQSEDEVSKYESTAIELRKHQETAKTEKSVHFATDNESEDETTLQSFKTSLDIHTVLPSEHLYSGDTFLSETEYHDSTDASTNPTDVTVSYGTNTFIALESEAETRTASDISQSESLASSTVFSQRSSGSGGDRGRGGSSDDSSRTHREWRDVTDIVKDIDELEESEFVTKRESFFPEEDEATDITDSEDEEMAGIQRDHFLLSTIRRLKLRDVLSPRSLATELAEDGQEGAYSLMRKQVSKEETDFCQQMIENCRKPGKGPKHATEKKPQVKASPRFLEHYGLNSAIVDRLRFENLQKRLDRKSEDLDKDIEKSRQFIKQSKGVQAEIQRQAFLKQTQAQVLQENTGERIQAHLIKMHPVKCFAEFVKGLPKFDENSREILYKYKRRLEAEMNGS